MERQQVTKTNQVDHKRKMPALDKPVFYTSGSANPLVQLQRNLGNQAFSRLVQAKLQIGQPGDILEQEADRVAEQVMGMPGPIFPRPFSDCSSSDIQKKYAKCNEGEEKIIEEKPLTAQITPLIQRQVTEEPEEEEEETLQAKEVTGGTPTLSPPIDSYLNSIRGNGQPLPESIRAFFEPRFGYDFSSVRIHKNGVVSDSAQTLNALAYTFKNNIVFGTNQYAPESDYGKKLLAHELTHVIQQNNSARDGKEIIFRRVASDYEKIKSDLSYGVMDWVITEEEAHNVIQILSTLSDEDLQDTMKQMQSHDLATRLLDNISDSDRENYRPLLGKIYDFLEFKKVDTELGGLGMGNFDISFSPCNLSISVKIFYLFDDSINAIDRLNFKNKFDRAVNRWNAGYGLSLVGLPKEGCNCCYIPIKLATTETSRASAHKVIDVEKDYRRSYVISDLNTWIGIDEVTLAHELGHVIGLYDEYDGGWLENMMWWHVKGHELDVNALMNTDDELRDRYFINFQRWIKELFRGLCTYRIQNAGTSPVRCLTPGDYNLPKEETRMA